MSRRRIRILLLFGGRSAEHDVSVASAIAMMRALEGTGIEVLPVGISRVGQWQLGDSALRMLGDSALFRSSDTDVCSLALVNGARSFEESLRSADVVFPLLHGPYGEDGTVQGLLELADVPYVGSGVLGSALGMDKIAMKAVFEHAGLPVVPYRALSRSAWRRDPQAVEQWLEDELGYPMFVKPANMGSSVGISKVHGRQELRPALGRASRHDRRLLVERGLEARELECGVLGNDEPSASVVGEIQPGEEYYSYEAKYIHDCAVSVIPADVPHEVSQRVREMAVTAFRAVDAAGMARVDFFLVGGRDIYINEINTIPGFTPISQFPRLWAASGVSYPELVERLAELALERHAQRPAPGDEE